MAVALLVGFVVGLAVALLVGFAVGLAVALLVGFIVGLAVAAGLAEGVLPELVTALATPMPLPSAITASAAPATVRRIAEFDIAISFSAIEGRRRRYSIKYKPADLSKC